MIAQCPDKLTTQDTRCPRCGCCSMEFVDCATCGGDGWVDEAIKDPCPRCLGKGGRLVCIGACGTDGGAHDGKIARRIRDLIFMGISTVVLLIAIEPTVLRTVAQCVTAKEHSMAVPDLFDSGLPRGVTELVSLMFTDAAGRLKRVVLNPAGRTQVSREFRQARAAQLVGQVEQVRRQLGATTSLWIGKNVPVAYADGKRRGDQQAKDAGVVASPWSGSFSLVDQRAVTVFAQDIAADLNRAADSMAERATSLLRRTAQIGLSDNQISTILAGGVIDGTPVQTIRALRNELIAVHGSKVQIHDRNGEPMEFDAGYYAEMVARTKTREATVKARHQRLQELDLDLVAIVGRVSQNFCTAFLGQVFSLSGKSAKYPAYARLPGGGPPFHPHCSKSTRPFIEELASKTQLRNADGLDDADKLLGMDQSKAQRTFKDLQLHAQVKGRYVTTEKKLFS